MTSTEKDIAKTEEKDGDDIPSAEAAAAQLAADAEPGVEQAQGGEDGDGAETVEDEMAAALAAARTEATENYDRFLRASAELDNFRKRTVRLRSDSREEALKDVLLQVAPLLDNMRRALAQETADAGALRQGLELIHNQFQDILKGYGLEEIDAVGKPFDPNFHDAMMEVPSGEHPPGTVVQEMEKGYALRDKVIRPSRVVVSKAPEEGD